MYLFCGTGGKTLLEADLTMIPLKRSARAALGAVLLSASLAPALGDTVPDAAGELSPRSFAWQPEPGDTIHFDVFRNGSEFGHHIVSFESDEAGDIAAVIDVDLRAGLGPITLFRYALDARETWRDGYVLAVEGKVNDDGDRKSVKARRDSGELDVDGTEFSGELPLTIIPASHWNIWQTEADRILSTESGKVIDVEVRALGRETIEAGGEQIEARKYLMDSDIDGTLWYDDQDRWVKLAFEARGQDIEYVLRDLY